jgi:iron complex outermembrane recepter protein
VTANAYWSWNKLFLNLRESFYSKTSLLVADPTSGLFVDRLPLKSKFITDVEIGAQLTHSLRLSIGANNLFNIYPDEYPAYYRGQQYAGNSASYVEKYSVWSPFGINGGYYYGRIGLNF